MYFNYLEILLAVFVTFLFGWGGGFLYGETKRGKKARRHQELFSDLSVEFLHWALGDPRDSDSLLKDIPHAFDDRKSSAHSMLFLLQGALHRQAGNAQKAFKIHQSLLAKPEIEKGLRGVIEFQCALDLFEQGRLAEADEYLKKLPRKWKALDSVQAFRERLDKAQAKLQENRL